MTDTTGTTNTIGNPLSMYDLTIPCDRYSLEQVKQWMRANCKRWVFQQEIGDTTSYNHYQCRFSLLSKKRLSGMKTKISKELPGSNVTPTSNPTHLTGNEFYVTKEDTRVDGPWDDKNDINPLSIPTRFRDTPIWRPWQLTVLELISLPPNDRSVNLIVDSAGNNGKSFLTLWLMSRQQAARIPPQKDARDIMRMVMNMPTRSTYFIDLPRAISHRDHNSIFAAIEEIKNGYAYDDRYRFQEKLFDPPHVWVFTNTLPDISLLSRGRWITWEIWNNNIIPYEREPPPPRGLTLEIIPTNNTPRMVQRTMWGENGSFVYWTRENN